MKNFLMQSLLLLQFFVLLKVHLTFLSCKIHSEAQYSLFSNFEIICSRKKKDSKQFSILHRGISYSSINKNFHIFFIAIASELINHLVDEKYGILINLVVFTFRFKRIENFKLLLTYCLSKLLNCD